MAEVTLVVPALHCGGCVTSLQVTLGGRPGIQRLKGDASTRTLTVAYDESRTTAPEITEALTELGFPPRPQAA